MNKGLWWGVACLVLSGCTTGSGLPDPVPGGAKTEGAPAASPAGHEGEPQPKGGTPTAPTGGGAAAVRAPTTPPLPPVPLGRGPVLEALAGAFGKPVDGPEVAAVRKAVGGGPKEARSDDGRLTLYWWDKGLSLTFGTDRSLESATFSGGNGMWGAVLDEKPKPYPGALPYGLGWDDGPDAVERKLGRPDPPATPWAAGYKALGLRLGFVNRPTPPGTRLDEVTLLGPPPGPAARGPAEPGSAAREPADDAEGRAAELVRKRGGTVTRDGTVPGNPVVGVDLRGTEVTDAVVKELLPLRHLGALHLGYSFNLDNKMTDAGARDVARLGGLTRLDLGNCRLTDAGVKELASLGSLTDLALSSNQVTAAGLKELARLPNLAALHLEGGWVTDAGLKALAPLPKLTSLSLAASAWNGNGVTDAGLKELAPCRNLERLDLTGNRVTDAGVRALAPLPKLSALHLVGTGVTDAGVRELARRETLTDLSLGGAWVSEGFRTAVVREVAALGGLKRLRLHGVELTDANLRELARLKALTVLALDGCRVTDAGIGELAPLQNLARLDLSGTPVSDAGVKELARLPHLTALDLSRTRVTDAGVTELRRALPKCVVRK